MITVKEQHPAFDITVQYVPVEELIRRELAPSVLPPGWGELTRTKDGIAYGFRPEHGRRFSVILSAAREQDGKIWLHVSLSKWAPSGRAQEEPTWSDIRHVKQLFIGPKRKAIIVLPEESTYVNLAEVHHLWCCLDEDPLPDFTRGTNSI